MNHKSLSRIDAIGLNGGDGIHYDKPRCYLSKPNARLQIQRACVACHVYETCISDEDRYEHYPQDLLA